MRRIISELENKQVRIRLEFTKVDLKDLGSEEGLLESLGNKLGLLHQRFDTIDLSIKLVGDNDAVTYKNGEITLYLSYQSYIKLKALKNAGKKQEHLSYEFGPEISQDNKKYELFLTKEGSYF